MTERDEKSTLFPIRLPLKRPSFPLSLALIALSALPDLWCLSWLSLYLIIHECSNIVLKTFSELIYSCLIGTSFI
jgi:hypothetical protein